ncbi:MAG: NAD-dependent epimerase/dehydratase [Candidatus Peregrinibacteria bacterium Greene0416_62]|nr:MAG: NAD-dependent epimerase/dehydratase [Candidatus Peregrinibacteria bacterium Greene0416_62]TSC96767.1 MAG: NAD-dependent epimerase/dehydratase [Candidatus Peregrinibacteria bacterium Greene1014_49]
MHYLVTGGAGFFGGILKHEILKRGHTCVSIDLERDDDIHPQLVSVQGDIRDRALMERLCSGNKFDAVMHCAAILAHAVNDKQFLWSCNVEGTRSVAECAKRFGIRKIVFISSNCLWGIPIGRPIHEDDPPAPVEIYGRSKWEGERILQGFAPDVDSVIIRCPTIIDEGRLGLLSILFEFIDEGRKVWVIGGGKNRYQFIYAADLVDACLRSATYSGSAVFHIGSDNVPTFRECYKSIIARAGTASRVASLPRFPALLLMRLCYRLGLSPLGPYQYKMIAEDAVFDTTRIKRELGWSPTVSNTEMLWRAYRFYHDHRREITERKGVSAHKQAAKMGIIRLLKWIS